GVDLDAGGASRDHGGLSGEELDRMAATAVFGEGARLRDAARWVIRRAAATAGIWSASIQDLYTARGRGECAGFTVPAMNIRGLTYDVSRAAFRAAVAADVGAVIFEIARSEIGYTDQRPAEYIAVVTAAALRERFRGPLFIQGDHFQFNPSRYAADAEAETQAVLDLTREAIEAGFMNIDIDASTLVDLERGTLDEQQRVNYERAAQCVAQIRSLQPAGIDISVGGEIGEVGKKNSTPEELAAFMDGLRRTLEKTGCTGAGPSKISVQSGTSHGGIPLPDGTVAAVKLDFQTLERLSSVARDRYGMAGAVQHGASTLPAQLFDRFPQVETAEIHLATGFQNIIYSHPSFPQDLLTDIRKHLQAEHAAERADGQTVEQFIYKTRKKAFGPFKRRLWEMDAGAREAIGRSLQEQFSFLFDRLAVRGTRSTVDRFVVRRDIQLPRPEGI
ncbi:MAG: class II fructose-bisphosphate aldolase, partial [Acidobacteriota bacterium]